SSARPVGEKLHAPLLLAVAVVATALPSTVKWIAAFGSAVPASAELDETLSVDETPVSDTSAAVTVGVAEGGGVTGGVAVPDPGSRGWAPAPVLPDPTTPWPPPAMCRVPLPWKLARTVGSEPLP